MKRVIIKLTLFLLLGAVVTVAVAWGVALTVEYGENGVLEEIRYADAPEVTDHVVLVTHAFGSEQLFGKTGGVYFKDEWSIPNAAVVPATNAWPDWSRIRNCTHEQFIRRVRADEPELVGEEARGWPFYCLCWQHCMRRVAEPNIVDFGGIRGGVDLGGGLRTIRFQNAGGVESADEIPAEVFARIRTGGTDARVSRLVLPYSIIWPGFAINTLFYAGILWLLFAGPGRVRRWRRIRRGLCAKCAYPVGTSNVCTECGAHINKKTPA